MPEQRTEHLFPPVPTPDPSPGEIKAWITTKDPLSIRIDWALIDGRHRAVSIRVERGGRPVGASELHNVPFGSVYKEAARSASSVEVHGLSDEERQRFLAEWDDGGVKRGRPRLYGPEFWLRVADVYATAKRNGDPIRASIVDAFDECESLGTAGNWCYQIRKMGLYSEGAAAITQEDHKMTATGTVTPPSGNPDAILLPAEHQGGGR